MEEGISEDEEKESEPEQLTELESTDNPETQSQEKLDLQAKFSALAQFGYNGAKIPVFQPAPTPQGAIGTKPDFSQIENNYQEKPQELQSNEGEKDNKEISTEGEKIQFSGGVSGDEDKVGESKNKSQQETDTVAQNLVDKIAPTTEELVQEKPNPKEEENNKTESNPNLNTKAVSSTSEVKPETLINNSYDPTLLAYGSETKQTFDGGTARLNTFGEINRQMTTIWRLTSNNSQDDLLTEVNLNFRFSNNEQKTIQPEIPTPRQIVRGRLSVEFGTFNGLTLSGKRQGTVIMNGTARSYSHTKYIPDIESTCELYDADVLPESAKETIGRASVEGKLYTYSLNPDHDGGGSDKAIVFQSVLGFSRLNMDDLARQLVFNLEEATPKGRNDQGLLYRQIIRVNGANGRTANVLTGWIIRDDDKTIRLTTAYVDKKQ